MSQPVITPEDIEVPEFMVAAAYKYGYSVAGILKAALAAWANTPITLSDEEMARIITGRTGKGILAEWQRTLFLKKQELPEEIRKDLVGYYHSSEVETIREEAYLLGLKNGGTK